VSNVIVQNLLISMPNGDDAGDNVDAIHVEKSHQIWIDHCDLSSNGNSDAGASYDDLVGISDGSDFVTVSWTRYHDHGATGIIGRSDSVMAAAEDADKEHVTFDHDWFENVASGPRARFGYVHIFNTYFDHVSDYGVAAIDGVNVRIENSVFDLVTPVASDPDFGPVTTDLEGDLGPGYAELVNNTPRGSGNNHITTQATDWTPPDPMIALMAMPPGDTTCLPPLLTVVALAASSWCSAAAWPPAPRCKAAETLSSCPAARRRTRRCRAARSSPAGW